MHHVGVCRLGALNSQNKFFFKIGCSTIKVIYTGCPKKVTVFQIVVILETIGQENQTLCVDDLLSLTPDFSMSHQSCRREVVKKLLSTTKSNRFVFNFKKENV